MEIKGKVILALPEQTGTSQKGNSWKKREYVIETHDSFPRKIHFDFFGDRADQYPLQAGDEITLFVDIESREFNVISYTSIRGWKAEKEAAAPVCPGAIPPMDNVPPPPPAANDNDDLPF